MRFQCGCRRAESIGELQLQLEKAQEEGGLDSEIITRKQDLEVKRERADKLVKSKSVPDLEACIPQMADIHGIPSRLFITFSLFEMVAYLS